jgi:hypothetical protein
MREPTPETSTDKSTMRITGEAFVIGFFSTLGMLTAFEVIKNRHVLSREFKAVCQAIADS